MRKDPILYSINQPVAFPFEVIKNESVSYTGAGNAYMDKTKKQYEFKDSIITIESRFATDNVHINDLMKTYLLEQKKTIWYNEHSSTTVVTSREEESQ